MNDLTKIDLSDISISRNEDIKEIVYKLLEVAYRLGVVNPDNAVKKDIIKELDDISQHTSVCAFLLNEFSRNKILETKQQKIEIENKKKQLQDKKSIGLTVKNAKTEKDTKEKNIKKQHKHIRFRSVLLENALNKKRK